jgi:hypothetical protein
MRPSVSETRTEPAFDEIRLEMPVVLMAGDAA